MGISIYNLYEASLLVINAIAVLNEERFLVKIGWGRHQATSHQQNYGRAAEPGLKANLLNLIHSIRTVMRVPLIFLNVFTIMFKLVAG